MEKVFRSPLLSICAFSCFSGFVVQLGATRQSRVARSSKDLFRNVVTQQRSFQLVRDTCVVHCWHNAEIHDINTPTHCVTSKRYEEVLMSVMYADCINSTLERLGDTHPYKLTVAALCAGA